MDSKIEKSINLFSTNFITIKRKDKNFAWYNEIKDNFLIISVYILNKNIEMYKIKKNLEDWKKIHYIFNGFQNLEKIKEFFINALNKKDIEIKIAENKIILEINIEILYERQTISIELEKTEINKDELIRQLFDAINNIQNERKNKPINNEEIKKELEDQKSEINFLKNEILNLKELNQIINFYDSSIIQNIKEINLIKEAIKQRLGKEVKYFKKLYFASKDGEGASIFHKLCDNKENTISFVKTGGNRRFGGFTTQTWNQVSSYTKTDQHAFVFSLDKLKIYPYTNNGRAIRCDNNYLPTFGVGDCDFRLYDKPISGKNLYTHQTSGDRSYNYSGDGTALSEDGNGNCIATIDVEVYEVILNEK